MLAYKSPALLGKLGESTTAQNDEIAFNVLSSENGDYSEPFVFDNLSNPITLCYICKDVKTNFQIRSFPASLIYDGRLLKSANVDITSLNCSVSFLITITTSSEEKYICKLYLTIPIKTEDSIILDGNIHTTINLNGLR